MIDHGRTDAGYGDGPDAMNTAAQQAAMRAMARRLGLDDGAAAVPVMRPRVRPHTVQHPVNGLGARDPGRFAQSAEQRAAPTHPDDGVIQADNAAPIPSDLTSTRAAARAMLDRWTIWTIAIGARLDLAARWRRVGVAARLAAMLDAAAEHGDIAGARAWRTTRTAGVALGTALRDVALKARAFVARQVQNAAPQDVSPVTPAPTPPAMTPGDHGPLAPVPAPVAALPLFVAAEQAVTTTQRQPGLPLGDEGGAGPRTGTGSMSASRAQPTVAPSKPHSPSTQDAATGGGGPRWQRMIRDPAFSWGVAAGVAAMLVPSALVLWQRATPDRAATEQIVRDLVARDPAIVADAMRAQGSAQTQEALSAIRTRVETPFAGSWAGNASGDVTLVMFSDYDCGFCRRASADVERLLQEDPKLKVVWRELPILSEDSIAAARIALIAARQGRYPAFHRALFAAGAPSTAAIDAAARTAGVDLSEGARTVTRAEADREFADNVAAARALGFQGTPAWVIGDQTLTGAVGVDALRAAIAAARDDR